MALHLSIRHLIFLNQIANICPIDASFHFSISKKLFLFSSFQNTERRKILGTALAPYLNIAELLVVGVGLLGGLAGENWPSVLALVLARIVGNAALIVFGIKLEGKIDLFFGFAVVNLLSTSGIVLLTGGHYSPFWLLYIIDVFGTAVFAGLVGAALTFLIAGTVLVLPPLWAGSPAPFVTNIFMQLLILGLTGFIAYKLTLLLLQARERQVFAEAKAQLAAIVESSDDAIIGSAADGVVVNWNVGAEKIFGYIEEEMIGRSAGAFFPAERNEELSFLLHRIRQGERINQYETVCSRKDGTRINVSLTLSPVTNSVGVITGVSTIARDITQRLRVEEQNRLLAHTVGSSSDLITITDLENRFIFVNKAFLLAYGYQEQEVLGQKPEMLILRGSVQEGIHKEILHQTLHGGWQGELLNRRKDGSLFPIHLSTSAIIDEQGNILGLVGISRDITERKKAEARLAAFSHLGERLSAAQDTREAALIIVDVADRLFGWDASALDLYSSADDKIRSILNIDTINGKRTDVPPTVTDGPPTSRMRKVIKTGAELILRDESTPQREDLIAFGDKSRLSASIMIVPIRTGTEVIGIVSIQTYRSLAYNNEDLQTFQDLADHCAGALERVRVQASLEQRNRQLSVLNKVVSAVSSSLDKKEIAQIISEQLVIQMEFSTVFVMEYVEGVKEARLLAIYPQRNHFLTVLKRFGLDLDSVAIPFRMDENEIYAGLLEGKDHIGQAFKDLATAYIPARLTQLAQRVYRVSAVHAVPIMNQGKLVGAIVVGSSRAVISVEERSIVLATASQIAPVIENARLFEHIKVSEEKYRTLFEESKDVVYMSTREGKVVDINPAGIALFGYSSKDEFFDVDIGRDLYANPEDRQRFRKMIEKQGFVKDYEVHTRRRDGEILTTLITSTVVRDQKGVIIGYRGIIRDITQQKKIETALLESEERYRSLVETAQDVIYTLSPDGILTSINSAFDSVTGWKRSEWIGQHFSSLVYPDDLPLAYTVFQRSLQGFKNTNYEVRIRSKSGELITGEFVSTPQVKEKKIVGILGIARNITERKKAEEAVRESEKRYRQVVENATDVIFSTDQRGNFTYANAAALKTVEYSLDELRRLNYLDLILPEHRKRVSRTYYRQYIERRMTLYVEFPFKTKVGEVKWFAQNSNIMIEEGRIVGFHIIARDITDRKRSEELRLAMEAAEETSRAKSQFLTTVSHELRTPLSSVIGFANVLLKNKEKNLTGTDLLYLSKILENGIHLLGLINNILDLSKIESGKMELHIVPVSVDDLIHSTIEQVGVNSRGKNLKVVTEIPQSLHHFDTDEGKLRQVLINLIGNAIKFTEKGSVTVRVTAHLMTRRPVRIDVIDTGIGIPEDRLHNVFDAFQQADGTTARKYGGTGLGLTICRSLCELLGFKLTASSTVGQGSTFSVILDSVQKEQNVGRSSLL